MEFRQLGSSGLQVPVLGFGAGTFGGGNEFFKAWGSSDVAEATRLIDICLDASVNLFDTADVYSKGLSEEILGKAIAGKRNRVLISTKATFPMGDGPNDLGSSRHHLIQSCEDSLRRLNVDHIDIYHMHGFDALTSVEETLQTLDTLVKSGKVRYIACSNFSGWHLMKSLSISERYGWARLHKTAEIGPQVLNEHLYKVVDAIDEIAKETGKTVPQIALNWLLQRPSVVSVIMGARNEGQLRQNLASVGWNLSKEQVAKLDAASSTQPVYPYWHQRQFATRNPIPV
jgi:aryl-alcohol dehydrogenase-like predicted oxidoreductase